MLLTEEVLKMVVAIIGLALLAYFLVSFFSSDIKAKKQKEALNTLDKISEIISQVTTSGGNITALQPKKWTLFSFVGEDKKPSSCFGQNCMCICKKVIGDVFDWQIKKCAKEGTCLVVSNLERFEDIKIEAYTKEGTTNINIREINGRIQINKI